MNKDPENDDSTLNERQKVVLRKVCDSFISTGIPVGSRTISKFTDLAWSPATIRNEMADLESMGYLYSPHVSAGRVPTEKGYRFYVNVLLELERMSRIEETLVGELANRWKGKQEEESQILRSAIRFASDATSLPGIALIPQKSENSIRSVQLFRVLEDRAMFVMVDDCGHITDQLVSISPDLPDSALQRLTNFLNQELCNRKSTELEAAFFRQSHDLMVKYNSILSQLAQKLKAAVRNPVSEAVFLEGFMNFFDQPEFQESEKIRQMLHLLDEKDNLLKLLAKSLETGEEIMVNIGSESGLAVQDLSIVTARYCGPNRSFGRIGLIGPLRMDYAKVVAVLGRLSKSLGDLFLNIKPPGRNPGISKG